MAKETKKTNGANPEFAAALKAYAPLGKRMAEAQAVIDECRMEAQQYLAAMHASQGNTPFNLNGVPHRLVEMKRGEEGEKVTSYQLRRVPQPESSGDYTF